MLRPSHGGIPNGAIPRKESLSGQQLCNVKVYAGYYFDTAAAAVACLQSIKTVYFLRSKWGSLKVVTHDFIWRFEFYTYGTLRQT